MPNARRPPPVPEEPARRTPPATRASAGRPVAQARAAARPEPPPVGASRRTAEAGRGDAAADASRRRRRGAEGKSSERFARVAARARRTILNRIDYRALNADARTQYDTAKRFVTQAEEALRAKNLVFARNLADKAAALAAQLAGK